MKKWVQKYSGLLRNLRLTYWFFNLINLQQLKKNKPLYKQFGINKPIWQSLAHVDIKQASADIPWMDRPSITANEIKSHANFASFSNVVQQQLLAWPTQGFMVIPGLLAHKVHAINTEIERLTTENIVDYNFTGKKIMDAWQHSAILNEVFNNETILNILAFVFQKKPIPFQTINFIYGSEQKPHSDFIHMTTEPMGYLAAQWIALQDIEENSGELVYYPGSHKLNYILSEDYTTENNGLLIGENNYDNYEQKIEQIIRANNLQPHYFRPKQGDVLIWHANLLHGGSAIKNKALTRKSMVAHYYADGVLCYHEISQRPAVIKS